MHDRFRVQTVRRFNEFVVGDVANQQFVGYQSDRATAVATG